MGYLLDNIECNDHPLQASLATVRADNDPDTGKRYDFEAAVAFIVASDPVTRRLSSRKRGSADIASVTATPAAVSSLKAGLGTSGVHLRYHTEEEYAQLSTAQKAELYAWRRTPEGKAASAKSRANHAKRTKKAKVAACSAAAPPAPVAKVAQDSQSTAPDATVVGAVAMTTRPFRPSS